MILRAPVPKFKLHIQYKFDKTIDEYLSDNTSAANCFESTGETEYSPMPFPELNRHFPQIF